MRLNNFSCVSERGIRTFSVLCLDLQTYFQDIIWTDVSREAWKYILRRDLAKLLKVSRMFYISELNVNLILPTISYYKYIPIICENGVVTDVSINELCNVIVLTNVFLWTCLGQLRLLLGYENEFWIVWEITGWSLN